MMAAGEGALDTATLLAAVATLPSLSSVYTVRIELRQGEGERGGSRVREARRGKRKRDEEREKERGEKRENRHAHT
jgi:hypothetical protein